MLSDQSSVLAVAVFNVTSWSGTVSYSLEFSEVGYGTRKENTTVLSLT